MIRNYGSAQKVDDVDQCSFHHQHTYATKTVGHTSLSSIAELWSEEDLLQPTMEAGSVVSSGD